METTRKNTMLSLMAAAAAGVAAGMLFAPRSGKETRSMLQQRSKQFADKAKTSVDENVKRAKQTKDTMTGAVKSGVEKTKEELNASRSRLKEEQDRIKEPTSGGRTNNNKGE